MNKLDYDQALEEAGYKLVVDSRGRSHYTKKIEPEEYQIESRGNFLNPNFVTRVLRNVDKLVEEITR